MAVAIHRCLANILLTDTDITALVVDRIYPQAMPDLTIPAITITSTSNVLIQALVEQSTLVDGRFQIDIFARRKVDAETLCDNVRRTLDRFRGIQNSRMIYDTKVNNWFDSFDQPEDGTDIGIYRIIMDVSVWYTVGTD